MEIDIHSVQEAKNFTVLDVGSYKLKCVNFNIEKNNKICILAKSECDSLGIKGGSVLNIEKATSSISKVITNTERLIDEEINDIYINVADCGMRSATIKTQVNIVNKKVSKDEIDSLKQQAIDKSVLPVLHSIRLGCAIDNVQEVSDPNHMYGSNLSAKFCTISAAKTLLLNLENCLARCSLRLRGAAFSAYTAAISTASEDEKETGVVVIDIGCNYTSISVFQNKKCYAAFAIPVGGIHLTKDLACGLGVSLAVAERIKKLCSYAMLDSSQAENRLDLSAICNSSKKKDITLFDIASITKPRLEEILEMAQERVINYNFSGIVITGGSSNILGIDKIASCIFNKDCRIQSKINYASIQWEASYAALTGVVMQIHKIKNQNSTNDKKPGYIKRIFGFCSRKSLANITR